MKAPRKFSFAERARSFGHAFNGLKILVETQHNARIHLVMTPAVLGLAWFLNIGRTKTALLVLVMAFVWAAEALNTSLEILITMVSPQYSAKAGRAKDAAAAAVFVAALGAFTSGLLLLGPPLIDLLRDILG